MPKVEYGVITEQNDLGLGFDLLNNKDNETVNEAMNKNHGVNNSQIINEEKKDK